MKIIDNAVMKVDTFQRRHKVPGFLFAVVKKFSDDQAGYQAALITYYGFLSLFPLLLVLTTVAGIAGSRNPELGRDLVQSVSGYFPVAGQALENSVNGITRTGPALIIGILFALYGARGIADSLRNAVNHIWHVPIAKRSGFPRSLLRSFGIIFGGGAGFMSAAIISGWASAVGHGPVFRILSIMLNLAILYLVFVLLLRLSLPLKVPVRQFRVGAAVSAIGLTVLQTVGTYFFVTQARTLSNSYSALFATTLGMLAWIYLQAQVLMYAVEIDTVRNRKLWPRSLSGKKLTKADKKVATREY